jgi:propanol-preferring alcohol dehydrogenase
MVLEQYGLAEREPLVAREWPAPEPGSGEIRVKVGACGVCRTDMHVIEREIPPVKLPIIPGHQVVGVVDKVGPGCTQFRVGDRAGIAWLRYTCGTCEFCRACRENLCPAQRFTGYHADGGYAEYAVVSEDFAYAIPDGFTDAQAAPLLCAGIVGYRTLLRSQLPTGGTLAMYGFGSSAHIVFQLAQARGCPVCVVTRGQRHRELARSMGAAWVGERAEGIPAPVDSAIIFAPAGELVPAALGKLKPGGTLALAGIHMTAIPQMDYQTIFGERNIHSVTANTRQDGRELLAQAVRIPIRPRVTEYALADANRALADLKADRVSGTAVLVLR